MPLASVTPLQKTLLLLSRMETFAPATGFASSRRVTMISVFWGLSLTLMPRFVDWTRVETMVGS